VRNYHSDVIINIDMLLLYSPTEVQYWQGRV